MILPWLLVVVLSLPLLLAEGWLCVTLLPVPCVTVGLGLFLAFSARTSAVPGLLVCAGLGGGAWSIDHKLAKS